MVPLFTDSTAELTEVFQVVIAVHTLPAQSAADVVEVVVPLLPQPAKSNAAARPIRSTGIIVRIAQPPLTALVGPRAHDERRAITEVTRATSRHRTPTHAAGAPRDAARSLLPARAKHHDRAASTRIAGDEERFVLGPPGLRVTSACQTGAPGVAGAVAPSAAVHRPPSTVP